VRLKDLAARAAQLCTVLLEALLNSVVPLVQMLSTKARCIPRAGVPLLWRAFLRQGGIATSENQHAHRQQGNFAHSLLPGHDWRSTHDQRTGFREGCKDAAQAARLHQAMSRC
jgi:hypothetical protein